MNLYLFEREAYARLYNCSRVELSSVPLSEREHPALGAFYLALGLLLCALYVPCLVAIWRHRAVSSCYKFMLLMGVLDVGGVLLAGALTGFWLLTGTVFCSAPGLIYPVGCCVQGLWFAETTVEVVLALNRCVDAISEQLGRRLFEGTIRCWCWMGPTLAYGLYVWFFLPPELICSIYGSWLNNPYAGYITLDDQSPYVWPLLALHDRFVAVSVPALYIVFFAVFYIKTKWLYQHEVDDGHGRMNMVAAGGGGNPKGTKTTATMNLPLVATVNIDTNNNIGRGNNNNRNQQQQQQLVWQKTQRLHLQKMTFLQVFLISVVNMLAAELYCVMQEAPKLVTPALIFTVQLTWILAHGLPPVIYLALNRTLRGECRTILAECFSGVKTMLYCFLKRDNKKQSPSSTSAVQQNQRHNNFVTVVSTRSFNHQQQGPQRQQY